MSDSSKLDSTVSNNELYSNGTVQKLKCHLIIILELIFWCMNIVIEWIFKWIKILNIIIKIKYRIRSLLNHILII